MDTKLTLRDAYNRYGSKSFQGTSTTVVGAQADAAALAVDLDAVSLAATVKTRVAVDELIASVPQAGANIDAGGTLHCRLDNGKLYGLKIPAINPSIVNADGSIDISDPLVTAFVAHFQTGGEYTVSEGNLITVVEYGELDR
jgi:hypothetical protein